MSKEIEFVKINKEKGGVVINILLQKISLII